MYRVNIILPTTRTTYLVDASSPNEAANTALTYSNQKGVIQLDGYLYMNIDNLDTGESMRITNDDLELAGTFLEQGRGPDAEEFEDAFTLAESEGASDDMLNPEVAVSMPFLGDNRV